MSRKFILSIILLIFLSSICFATTYYVKTDGDDTDSGTSWSDAFATIQKAIDTSSSGNEIWVKEGTYTLSSEIDVDKAVEIYGGFDGTETQRSQRDWRNDVTTVDGDDTYRCFNVTASATIDGFKIKDGYTTASGAGVYFGSSITLTLAHCSFISNDADGTWSNGGAIYSEGNLTIDNCLFYDNETADGGGALKLYLAGTTNIVNSCFISNSALGGTAAGTGGAIQSTNSDATITNCTFYKNYSASNGQTVLLGCGSGNGHATITFENCVLMDGQARGHDVYATGVDGATATIEFYDCAIDQTRHDEKEWKNGPVSYMTISTYDCDHVLTANAGFESTSDYDGGDNIWMTSDDGMSLLPDSPFIDKGDNSYISESYDIAGNGRKIDGDADGTETADRGAYERNLEIAFQVLSESSNDPVAIFDKLGNLFLKGTLSINQASITASADVNEFRIWDSSDDDVALINQSNGNMYITGGKNEEQSSITAAADVNEFIIKDDDGNIVADVNESGVLLLKGKVYEEYLE